MTGRTDDLMRQKRPAATPYIALPLILLQRGHISRNNERLDVDALNAWRSKIPFPGQKFVHYVLATLLTSIPAYGESGSGFNRFAAYLTMSRIEGAHSRRVLPKSDAPMNSRFLETLLTSVSLEIFRRVAVETGESRTRYILNSSGTLPTQCTGGKNGNGDDGSSGDGVASGQCRTTKMILRPSIRSSISRGGLSSPKAAEGKNQEAPVSKRDDMWSPRWPAGQTTDRTNRR